MSLPSLLRGAKSYSSGFFSLFLCSFLELTPGMKIFGGKGGGFCALLKGEILRSSCHTILLETDAYADVRTRHCQRPVGSARGDSLSAARWRSSLGPCEIKENLSYQAVLRTEAAFLSRDFAVWVQTPG